MFAQMLHRLFCAAFGVLACVWSAAAQPDLRGHGGPVRAIAISPDGARAISGSFDSSAIVWSLADAKALAILRFHDGAINAVLALPQGYVTAGEDGRIAIWAAGSAAAPEKVIDAHKGPIAGLALSHDRTRIASASWDGTIALVEIASGKLLQRFTGHTGNVNAVAFSPDDTLLASAGYDATLRLWRSNGGGEIATLTLPAALNAIAYLPNGEIAAGGADGNIFIADKQGKLLATIDAGEIPAIALASSPDGARLAAASPRGSVTLVDIAARRKLFTLTGPGLPVWSVAFSPDGRLLLTGGSDRLVRRWDAGSGDHLGAVAAPPDKDDYGPFAKMPGAEVFKACSVCHTLTPDGGSRAGPTLYGVFGRKAGSVAGYAYSEAFQKLDLVWTAETISKLFEIGPQSYTPGTKMPEQKVGNDAERAALIEFLKAATQPRP